LRSSTKTVVTVLVVLVMVMGSLACGYWQSIAMAEGLEGAESQEGAISDPVESVGVSDEGEEPEQDPTQGNSFLTPEVPDEGVSPTEGEGLSEGDLPIVEEPGNEELPQDPPSVEEPVPEDVTAPGDDPTPSEPVQPDIIEPPTEPPVEPVKVSSLTVEHILEWEGGQEALNTRFLRIFQLELRCTVRTMQFLTRLWLFYAVSQKLLSWWSKKIKMC